MEDLRSGTMDMLRQILDCIHTGLAVMDQDDILIHINGRFCEMTGYTKEEILGHPLKEFMDPEYLKQFEERRPFSKEATPHFCDILARSKDGTNLYFRYTPISCFDKNGHSSGRFAALTDMTELMQTKDLLQKATDALEKLARESAAELAETRKALNREIADRTRFSELFSKSFLMSPALMAINRFEDHVFLDVNHRFTRFTGYSREEIIGRTFSEVNVLSQNDHEKIYQYLEGKGHIYSEEMEYRTKSGNIRAGIFSAELIDVQGEKLVLSVHHDITERKQAQYALNKREEELSQRSAEIGEANTALRVLLKRRMEDQKNLEARLQQNIDELVVHYIRELKNCALDQRAIRYLNLLESNFKDIVSPFLNSISSGCKNLTPKEIQVANMIKEGMMSKDIAELLGVSIGTVDTHRSNIRKKLGLKKAKTNLRSYLLSLS